MSMIVLFCILHPFVYHFLLKFYRILFCTFGICTDLSKSNHSLANSTHLLHPLLWNFYKWYQFLLVSVHVNDCTTFFCILHPEICISFSTKILYSLLHLWHLQVESLSTKFYTTSFVSSGIFINSIIS